MAYPAPDFEGDGVHVPRTILVNKGDIIVARSEKEPVVIPVGDDGEVLTADSSTESGLGWAAGGGGAEALSDLTDVTLTSPADNDVLTFNGTDWVNQPVSGGGGSGDASANFGHSLSNTPAPTGTPTVFPIGGQLANASDPAWATIADWNTEGDHSAVSLTAGIYQITAIMTIIAPDPADTFQFTIPTSGSVNPPSYQLLPYVASSLPDDGAGDKQVVLNFTYIANNADANPLPLLTAIQVVATSSTTVTLNGTLTIVKVG